MRPRFINKPRTLLIAALVGWPVLAHAAETNAPGAQSSIPYVPTRHDSVKDMLWLAEVGTNDVVYDLGSGDGRVVIAAVRDFGARKAVRIEIDPKLIRESRENAAKASLSNRVEFIQGDLFTNDFSEASVVVLYLGHSANLDLRPKLVRILKPGSRIVSHQFGMGEWKPDKELHVKIVRLGMSSTIVGYYGAPIPASPMSANPDVPDFGYSGKGEGNISVWIVPAPVAGVWHGKVRVNDAERELQVTLHQTLAGVSGSFRIPGQTNIAGYMQADVSGDHLRLTGWEGSPQQVALWVQFSGRVAGDSLNGTLEISERGQNRSARWEARRDSSLLADYAGFWEWDGPTNSPVQLQIERRAGQVSASYEHQGTRTPVRDFYDFGGGFYFTHLLGPPYESFRSQSRRGAFGDGWLIGEAVVTESGIRGPNMAGTVAFYPYPPVSSPSNRTVSAAALSELAKRLTNAPPPQPDTKVEAKEGRRSWTPKRVEP